MLDVHSHILPCVDDGSESIEESIALVNMLKQQGVRRIIATPHFYANDESVTQFIARRDEAYEKLVKELPPDSPEILLGAEVRFYDGISRLDCIDKLCLGNTNLLLLEMHGAVWKEHTVKEIFDISNCTGVRVMLAHIERYYDMQPKKLWDELSDGGILMQSNASFFTRYPTRRKALKLLKNGYIRFIGSDCHGVQKRPPEMSRAFDIIKSKLGGEFVNDLLGYENTVFNKQKFLIKGE